MAKVPDDKLMAYADGTLSPLARAKIDAYLQGDPESRRRVEMFRATGAPLSRLYGQPMAEPVPAYLKEFVLNYPIEGESPKARSQKGGPTRWLDGLQEGARLFTTNLAEWLGSPARATRWQLAAALAVLLALGVGSGAFFHGNSGPTDLVAFNGGHIYASGPLSEVLEKELSGRDTRIGGVRGEAVTMRASLTFKSKQNTYCREYEVATPSDGGFVGLGCRGGDGKWALEVHLPANISAKDGIRTAGRPDTQALDAIVDRMSEGDVFGNEQEAAAIKNGWK